MPTTPDTDERQYVFIPKTDLSIHEAVLATPEDTALTERLTQEFLDGEEIHDALEITPEKEIVDGRHRWKGALPVQRIQYIRCFYTSRSPEDVVITKLTQRRHYSKSARAYGLRKTAIAIASSGRNVRQANLKKGAESPESRLNRLSGNKGSQTLAELAAKTGLSEDLLQQAIKLEKEYMPRGDKLIEDWLELHEDENDLWQAWRDEHPLVPLPWTCWRSTRLPDMGSHSNDPKSISLIPHNWREVEEDKIFNGIEDKDGDRRTYSLGASLKALGSCFATAGKPRPDLDPECPSAVITLSNKITTFSKTMWATWQERTPEERLEVCKKLAADVKEVWPEEARIILLKALSTSKA